MNRAASVAVVAALLASAARRAAAQSPAPIRVRVGGSPNDDMTPLVYAQRSGMFARAGLDVDVEKGLGGAAVAAAVAGGSYDIGKSVISAILAAHERGLPFHVIAPSSIENVDQPYGGLIYRRDEGVATGKDLDGKTIGLTELSSIAHIAVQAWMDQHGGDWHTVKFVEVPAPAMADAVERGRVIAGEANYPIMGEALASGRFKIIPIYGAIAPRFIGGVFYTTTAYSKSHPEAIRTFVRVYYEAARYTNAHHAATVQMMSEFTAVPAAVIATRPRVESPTELNLSMIQPTIDLYARYGVIRQSFPANELVDPNTALR